MHGKPKYGKDFTHFDYTSLQAKKGGTLKLGAQGTFDSLNGFIAKGIPADDLGLLYDTLTVSSGDEAFTRYGLIAESMTVPEDRSWIIFKLRPEARFHDGHPITADDVVFTFNLLMEKGSPIFQSFFAGVEKVEALNKHEVKFSFKPGVNRELALTVGGLQILPKHYWQSRDFQKTTLEPPLGSGPYKIDKVNAGRNITYTRVPDYWAKDLPVVKGLYNFDTISIDYYKDATVLLEALKAGEYDVRVENYSKQWANGYTGSAIEKHLLVQKNIRHENPTGMQGFAMNLRRDLFKDIRVRKALNLAFDFEWTNKNLFYDAYTRTASYFSNSELASSGLPSKAELKILEPLRDKIPPSVFTTPYKNPVSDGNGHNRKNLRAAKKLLEEAGWHVKDNKLVNDKTGKVFKFEIMLVQPAFERIVNPYVKALAKLGIEVTVKHVEVSQYISRTRSFDYDMVVTSFGETLSPGNEQKEYWHSSTADIHSSGNLLGVKNPAIDKLVELIIAAPTREDLITRTHALDRVLLHEYYMIPQWHIRSHRLAYWDKFDRPKISPKYDSDYSLGLMTWWIDPKKVKRIETEMQSLN